jgi:hypothetical protein
MKYEGPRVEKYIDSTSLFHVAVLWHLSLRNAFQLFTLPSVVRRLSFLFILYYFLKIAYCLWQKYG